MARDAQIGIRIPREATPAGDPSPAPHLTSVRPPGSARLVAMSQAMAGLRDDLGFETASLFVRGAGGWELLEREGPARPWHALLDPSVLEGTSEAAEYPDVRSIPGAGARLAGLGCASVAFLPLPEGGRLLLDSSTPCRLGGWIERARPYLQLLWILSGPAWAAGATLRNAEDVAALQRVFSACQEVLGRSGGTIEDLLASAREALHADELFLISERGPDLAVSSSPADGWPQRLPRELHAEVALASEPSLDDVLTDRLGVALGSASRALAAAFGRDGDTVEITMAGWAEGPAISPVSMVVVARAISTAHSALQARQHVVSTLLDRERTRMAYALHDGLTQTVAGAVLELEALHKRVQENPVEALATLQDSKTEIRRALGEIRAILFDLQRPIEDAPKASEPLTRYIEDVVKRWRLPARVAVEGDLSEVPARVLSVAYVVIREALANAAKHASHSNVTVQLSAGEHDLTVTVGDAGQGFTRRDEELARRENHIGLEMLRRRVGEIGGNLEIESRPGDGTRVVAKLPLAEAAS